ncbi:MAG: hypothetical protein M3Z96_05185 [Pseudomonadota bacterium]|nr:hypothetical protein [Pseudomonadota bacterium]
MHLGALFRAACFLVAISISGSCVAAAQDIQQESAPIELGKNPSQLAISRLAITRDGSKDFSANQGDMPVSVFETRSKFVEPLIVLINT